MVQIHASFYQICNVQHQMLRKGRTVDMLRGARTHAIALRHPQVLNCEKHIHVHGITCEPANFHLKNMNISGLHEGKRARAVIFFSSISSQQATIPEKATRPARFRSRLWTNARSLTLERGGGAQPTCPLAVHPALGDGPRGAAHDGAECVGLALDTPSTPQILLSQDLGG